MARYDRADRERNRRAVAAARFLTRTAWDPAPLDCEAARYEAGTAAGFQAADDDRRMDGGYYVGSQGADWLPYVNPVSAAFACQALEPWRARSGGGAQAHRRLPIRR